MATINVRVDDDVKKEAGAIFADLGLDMSTAINMFLHQAIMQEGLPFEAKRVPNAETLAALEELKEMNAHPEKYPGYKTIEELRRALEV